MPYLLKSTISINSQRRRTISTNSSGSTVSPEEPKVENARMQYMIRTWYETKGFSEKATFSYQYWIEILCERCPQVSGYGSLGMKSTHTIPLLALLIKSAISLWI